MSPYIAFVLYATVEPTIETTVLLFAAVEQQKYLNKNCYELKRVVLNANPPYLRLGDKVIFPLLWTICKRKCEFFPFLRMKQLMNYYYIIKL